MPVSTASQAPGQGCVAGGVTIAAVTDFELAHRYDTVNLYRLGAATKVELNRPERMNAWDAQLARDLLDALTSVAEDPRVRAVMLTGAGRAFSSGADLKASQGEREAGPGDLYNVLTQRYHPLILGVREMPKPVVAAVNGAAAGIGLSLALACDLVIATESPTSCSRSSTSAWCRTADRRCWCPRGWGSRGRPRWRCWGSASRPARPRNGA